MYPTRAAGYWVELNLAPGWHTVHCGGSYDNDHDGTYDFTLDVTDQIYVARAAEHAHAGFGQDCLFA